MWRKTRVGKILSKERGNEEVYSFWKLWEMDDINLWMKEMFTSGWGLVKYPNIGDKRRPPKTRVNMDYLWINYIIENNYVVWW